MALEGIDLAILSARLGVARLGASRLGFYPCEVESTGATEPGEYVWKEQTLPETQWELDDDCEGSVCGLRPEADFSYTVVST